MFDIASVMESYIIPNDNYGVATEGALSAIGDFFSKIGNAIREKFSAAIKTIREWCHNMRLRLKHGNIKSNMQDNIRCSAIPKIPGAVNDEHKVIISMFDKVKSSKGASAMVKTYEAAADKYAAADNKVKSLLAEFEAAQHGRVTASTGKVTTTDDRSKLKRSWLSPATAEKYIAIVNKLTTNLEKIRDTAVDTLAKLASEWDVKKKGNEDADVNNGEARGLGSAIAKIASTSLVRTKSIVDMINSLVISRSAPSAETEEK